MSKKIIWFSRHPAIPKQVDELNRNYIGFELDKYYCEIANERIRKAIAEKEVGE